MAWTTPKTDWATGELVAAGDMNAIGENLAALKHLSTTIVAYTTTVDISISWNDNFADIDSNLDLEIITAGGDVMVHFHGRVSTGNSRYDLEVDGSRIGNSDSGIWHSTGDDRIVSFTRLIQDLSAGSHSIKLQHSKYACTLYAGAQFWVREI